MKKSIIKSKKGFTIIEVVLVLAIAGLIFLMVFVALPNLQRTQRDTQRRNDLDRVSSSLTQYVSNNNALPSGDQSTAVAVTETGSSINSGWKAFMQNYLLANGEDTFEDPNGGSYYFQTETCTSSSCKAMSISSAFGNIASGNSSTDVNVGVIVIAKSASCKGDEADPFQFENNGNRKFAVAMKLEGNGVYCIDNN